MTFTWSAWLYAVEHRSITVPVWLPHIAKHIISRNREHEKEIQRIVMDSTMLEVWKKVDEAAENWCNSVNLLGAHEECKAPWLHRFLFVLCAKGGKLPDNDKTAQFKKVASLIHGLKNELKKSADDEAKRIKIQADYNYGWDFARDKASGKDTVPLSNLYGFLQDLQQHFENPNPVIESVSPHMPEKNTQDAQANLLFGELTDWFRDTKGKPYERVVLIAVKVALNRTDLCLENLKSIAQKRRKKQKK